MSDLGKPDVKERVRFGVPVILTAIKHVTAVVERRIVMVRRGVAVGPPATIQGTSKHLAVRACERGVPVEALGGRHVPDADVRLQQLFIPPPDILAVRSIGPRPPHRPHAVVVGSLVIVVCAIQDHRQVDLLEVAQTFRLNRLGFRAGKGRQEHGRKNGDNSDDHQQFDQREAISTSS